MSVKSIERNKTPEQIKKPSELKALVLPYISILSQTFKNNHEVVSDKKNTPVVSPRTIYEAARAHHEMVIPKELTETEGHHYIAAIRQAVKNAVGKYEVVEVKHRRIKSVLGIVDHDREDSSLGKQTAEENELSPLDIDQGKAFLQAFDKRMATRMGDKVDEVLFCGLPVVIPYSLKNSKDSWVGRLSQLIRQRKRQDSTHWYIGMLENSDCLPEFRDIFLQIRKLQIKQITEGCSKNPSTESVAALEKMLKDVRYTRLLEENLEQLLFTNLDDDQHSRAQSDRHLRMLLKSPDLIPKNQSIAEQAATLNTRSSALMRTFGFVEQGNLHSSFSDLEKGQIVTKNSEFGEVLEIINFEEFAVQHVPGFKAKFMALKMASLVDPEGAPKYQLLKMWTTEVANRLSDVLVQLYFAYRSETSQNKGAETSRNLDQFATLTEYAIQQVLATVNAQVPAEHYELRLDRSKVEYIQGIKYAMRSQIGKDSVNEQRVISKLYAVAHPYHPRPTAS